MSTDIKVHKAVVHSTNKETGICHVKIPAVTGQKIVKVGTEGLTQNSLGIWNVPRVGDLCLVALSRDNSDVSWVSGMYADLYRADVNGVIEAINAWDTGDIQILNSGALATDLIISRHILAGQIITDKLAANAVTADKIAANTITAGQIAANTITAAQIAANTITAAQIAADTITAGQIAANTITTAELATNAIKSVNWVAPGFTVSIDLYTCQSARPGYWVEVQGFGQAYILPGRLLTVTAQGWSRRIVDIGDEIINGAYGTTTEVRVDGPLPTGLATIGIGSALVGNLVEDGPFSQQGSFFDLSTGDLTTPGAALDGVTGDMNIRGNITGTSFSLLDTSAREALFIDDYVGIPGTTKYTGLKMNHTEYALNGYEGYSVLEWNAASVRASLRAQSQQEAGFGDGVWSSNFTVTDGFASVGVRNDDIIWYGIWDPSTGKYDTNFGYSGTTIHASQGIDSYTTVTAPKIIASDRNQGIQLGDTNHGLVSTYAPSGMPWSDGPVLRGYGGMAFQRTYDGNYRWGYRCVGAGVDYFWINDALLVGTAPNDSYDTHTLRVVGNGYFDSTLTSYGNCGGGNGRITIGAWNGNGQFAAVNGPYGHVLLGAEGITGDCYFRGTNSGYSTYIGQENGYIRFINWIQIQGMTSGYLGIDASGYVVGGWSRREFKEDIIPLPLDTGDIIDRLEPVQFIFKNLHPEFGELSPEADEWRRNDIKYGFIVDDVVKINEKLAFYNAPMRDVLDEDGNPIIDPTDPYGKRTLQESTGELEPSDWDFKPFIAIIVKELQQLRKRVAQLEAAGV